MKAHASLVLAIMVSLVAAFAVEEKPALLGLNAVYRLDLLPVFKPALNVASISSYDRSGGNDDGFSGKYSFVRKEGDYLVLADLKGPGVIYRFWTPTPTDDPVEFLFDGEAEPRITVKFREIFLGKHPGFPEPLVGFGAGGYYSYVPLPYAKSCVVRIKAPKVQFYQINYADYPAGQVVDSFDPARNQTFERDQALKLFASSGLDITSFSAPSGAKTALSRKSVTVAPAAAVTVFETSKPGRIVGLRVSSASAIAGKKRDLVLRISFDGRSPSVLCPLDDFFGYAWGQPAVKSLLLGTVNDTNYCYFPMPFKKKARIEIVSERSYATQLHIEVVHAALPQKPDEGQFCAVWNRENPTTDGKPFTFLDVKGRGHLVAAILQVQGFTSGQTLFFEGDDQATIDGELRIHGTGSEDFFNGGWYDVPDRWEKNISFPLSGCLGYLKPMGRTGGYRVFLGDTYSFSESLRLTMEHSGEKNSIPTDNVSVAMFYAATAPALPDMPVLDKRAVRDPAELVFPTTWQTPIHAWSFDGSLIRKKLKVGSEEVRCLSLSTKGNDWFGAHFISPVCEVPSAGFYTIYLTAVKGPAQGIVQLFQNENPVASPVDLYASESVKSGRLLMGRLRLEEGKNNLMFKIAGRNPASSGQDLDLIEIICSRDGEKK